MHHSRPTLPTRWCELVASGLTAATILGCSACPTAPESATQHATASAPRIETTDLAGRPRLRLVIRDAETRAVASLAVSVDGGASVTFSLAGLTEQRLRNAGFEVTSRAHGLGYSVQTPLPDAAALRRFIPAAIDALTKPVAPQEPLLMVRARAQQVRSMDAGSDQAVDLCSGEAQLAPGQPALSNDDRVAHQQLETWRRQQGTNSTALALVGPSAMLAEAQDVLEDTPELPTTASTSRDPWPMQDSLSVRATATDGVRLSIALRTSDVARAMSLAPRLRTDPLLHELLDALDTRWSIERVAAVARPRGACLRIDLHSATAAPDATETSRLARWVGDYAARWPVASDPWVVQDAITSQGEASEAAHTAAWLALSQHLDAGPVRGAVRFEVPAARVLLGETFLANSRTNASSVPFTERTAFEPGHSTLSVLIASPCGTATETARDAGKRATMLTALAAATSDNDFVVSPWLTVDGIGLLVQSRALNASETGKAHAERAARRLALALLSPLDGALTANARQSILNQLAGPDPDLSHLLQVLSGGQPSALEPRGNWTTVDALVHDEIDTARHAFIAEPLRLAVLANQSTTQGAELAQELSRLLAPLRLARGDCAAAPALVTSGFGQWRLEPNSAPRAPALVAVPLPGADSALGPSEAEWLAYLLNRKGGWLEQRLLAPRLANTAIARIWGGRRGRALTIELFASPEQLDAAIQRARTLLYDLSRGALPLAADITAASQFFQSERIRLQHDRRHRIVSLWRGTGAPASPNLAALQRYQAAAFAPDRHLVVVSEPTN